MPNGEIPKTPDELRAMGIKPEELKTEEEIKKEKELVELSKLTGLSIEEIKKVEEYREKYGFRGLLDAKLTGSMKDDVREAVGEYNSLISRVVLKLEKFGLEGLQYQSSRVCF